MQSSEMLCGHIVEEGKCIEGTTKWPRDMTASDTSLQLLPSQLIGDRLLIQTELDRLLSLASLIHCKFNDEDDEEHVRIVF